MISPDDKALRLCDRVEIHGSPSCWYCGENATNGKKRRVRGTGLKLEETPEQELRRFVVSGHQTLGQFQRLAFEQPAIDSVIEADKRLVIAFFDNLALVEH